MWDPTSFQVLCPALDLVCAQWNRVYAKRKTSPPISVTEPTKSSDKTNRDTQQTKSLTCVCVCVFLRCFGFISLTQTSKLSDLFAMNHKVCLGFFFFFMFDLFFSHGTQKYTLSVTDTAMTAERYYNMFIENLF